MKTEMRLIHVGESVLLEHGDEDLGIMTQDEFFEQLTALRDEPDFLGYDLSMDGPRCSRLVLETKGPDLRLIRGGKSGTP